MRKRKGDVFMQADIEQILSLIAGSYNTAFHRYRIGESTEEAAEETGKEESFDGGIRRWENPEYRDQRMIQELFDTLEKSQLTLYFDRFGCRYLLFPVDREEERALLSIGAVSGGAEYERRSIRASESARLGQRGRRFAF